MQQRFFEGGYSGAFADRIAFPLGGIGAGMVALSGTGALTQVSVRNRPELLNEPFIFAALHERDSGTTRVLEGPVPSWKLTYPWPDSTGTGRGQQGKSFGLPRCAASHFTPRFPFATVALADAALALTCELTGWSPFAPGQEDDASLPVAALEYRFTNPTGAAVDAVFSFHARNFLFHPYRPPEGLHGVEAGEGRFELFRNASDAEPAAGARFAVACDGALADARWFRGDWWDPITEMWRHVSTGILPEGGAYDAGGPSAGGSLYLPIALEPGEERVVRVRLSWFAPVTDLRRGAGPFDVAGREDGGAPHVPWYAARFSDHATLDAHWATEYDRLRAEAAAFADALHASTLPLELLEAVTANLTILKSPTLMRQADGRLWMWEGSADEEGSFEGSCTHVFNYAQSIAHLFPRLERTLREIEFFDNQDDEGHQNFRSPLPVRANPRRVMAAADGQLGGIVKLRRDWRVSGDDDWLRRFWPQARASLDYCIRTWDPKNEGWLTEPHHNTYDIEFWGPDGMAGSIYLAALNAATEMGEALGEDVAVYRVLAQRAKARLEGELFNGRYFNQRVQWDDRALKPGQSDETQAAIRAEGPKYQYGDGCLSDGVIGEWMARAAGLPPQLDPAKVRAHLLSVHRHNYRASLRTHANVQRPAYAVGDEAALLLCSWPDGGRPRFPFVYSDEAWTGIEYQVASHLILIGEVEAGCEIVRGARGRYDGRVRNPFSEFEWGHWYGRAMASWALLQAWSGQSYDARTRRLQLAPAVAGDMATLLVTATGYGLAGVRDGVPFLEVRAGTIPLDGIDYRPFGEEPS